METVFKYKMPILEFQIYGTPTVTIDALLEEFDEYTKLSNFLKSWAELDQFTLSRKITILKSQIARDIAIGSGEAGIQDKNKELTKLCLLNAFRSLALIYMRRLLIDLRDYCVYTKTSVNQTIEDDEALRILCLSTFRAGKTDHEIMDRILFEIEDRSNVVAFCILKYIKENKGNLVTLKVAKVEFFSPSEDTLAICTEKDYIDSVKLKIEQWRVSNTQYDGFSLSRPSNTLDTVFSPTHTCVLKPIHFKYHEIIESECNRLSTNAKLPTPLKEFIQLVKKMGVIRAISFIYQRNILDFRSQLTIDAYLKLYKEIRQKSRIIIVPPDLNDNREYKVSITYNGNTYDFEVNIKPYLWNEFDVVRSDI